VKRVIGSFSFYNGSMVMNIGRAQVLNRIRVIKIININVEVTGDEEELRVCGID